MIREPYYITVGKLAELGKKNIPDEFIPACHLIYSSPATISYNSPGAIGFGVKRAGLVMPESVMLLVSPGCCGRNSTILSSEEGYADRMFYLLMTETDVVTGRHLERIPAAVREIVETAEPRPKVVVICITCVDALLGTGLERVCRKCEEEAGVIVVPSYMYALEREGRKPPMTAIRQTLYSLLERKQIQPDMVNIMGFFTPMDQESELFSLLRSVGVKKINQISEMETLEDYLEMGAANFNLMLDAESRFAADDLKNRLGMPYIEFPRLFNPEKIHNQYMLLGSALGVTFDDQKYYEEAQAARDRFVRKYKGLTFAIGEMINANPYEMGASLAEMGMKVKAVYANVTPDDYHFINRLAAASPETKVYTGISPSMIHYKDTGGVDVAIGKDAAAYCPSAKSIEWSSEKQPFGFRAFVDFIEEIEDVLEGANNGQAAQYGLENSLKYMPGDPSERKGEYI